MKPDTDTLISLLPPGPPHRRMESFMALEAVTRSIKAMKGKYRYFTELHALQLATATRLPVLAIRWACERLQRAINADHSRSEAV